MRTFPGCNTPLGFFSYYDDLLAGQQRIFLLKGGPGTGKSTLMRHIGQYWQQQGLTVDWHHCSGDPTSLDAVCVPALQTLVVDATLPHALEPKTPGIREEIIALGNFWNRTVLEHSKRDMLHIDTQRRDAYRVAYALLREAAAAYQAEAEFFQPHTQTLWQAMGEWKGELIALYGQGKPPRGKKYRCFFTAITAMGSIHLAPSLLRDTTIRTLHGGPGSGISAFLDSVAHDAWERGHHCMLLADPLSPQEWEGLFLPDSKLMITRELDDDAITGGLYDSTLLEAAHALPVWADFQALLPASDKMIQQWRDRRRTRLQDAYAFLNQAREWHRQLEQYYIPAMDFDAVEERSQYIIREMQQLI